MSALDANGLRRAFTGFFEERGHTKVASSGLIPHHPRAPLFTNAGMNQFLPYFLGEEPPPYPRATSVQKCVRIRGKHDDIDLIGRDASHLSCFEMLGNFSFGDYFKEGAIAYAWELSTEVLGMDGDRIWATVHDTDDVGAAIWRDVVGLPAERIQRMGDDNFWEMGDTGPCGPCSELYFDKGPEYGEGGGPANGSEERFLEFWNLVFMEFERQPDRSLEPLPKQNIDTGAGLERMLTLLQGVDSLWDTDVMAALVQGAARATGLPYGRDEETDVALRILADHGRTMSLLISDGVFPSNEDKGYVLRRIIRRAVRQAFLRGVEKTVAPALVASTAEVMGEAYPDLVRNADFVSGVVEREEERFRSTLKSGLALLDTAIAEGDHSVPGEVAFKLHDTHGFPIELTREIAAERGADVDEPGFEAAMADQRDRARAARKGGGGEEANLDAYRDVLDEFGPTEFLGYQDTSSVSRVLAVLPAPPGEDGKEQVEIILDRTPFYAEGGGQMGDTGTITTATGTATVVDTTRALPTLTRHLAVVSEGFIDPTQEAQAQIDTERRDAIRRNHTGTHLLHWALRHVLGDHVKQQGSLVHPDYLRFDFSHYAPVSAEEIATIEDLVNQRVLKDEPVRAFETTKAEAEKLGAIAFFGDKYGDVVRVLEAGSESTELCGGTHVPALGFIGPIKVTSEASIGANTRRIFATTGAGTLARFRSEERLLDELGEQLRAKPEELPDAVGRLLAQRKALEDEVKQLRGAAARNEAGDLVRAAADGKVVARRDGLAQDQLKDLAVAARDADGVEAVVLIGSPDGERVALVAAVRKGSGLDARELIKGAARTVGGGGGGKDPELATAGGKDASAIDAALDQVRSELGGAA